jgi:fatty-acyl-CoA synthase
MVNLTSQILFHARRNPDRLAMVYEDQRISYAELADRALRLAGLLKERGVQPRQVVAAVMKNSAAFMELAFAVSHVGAVFLPVNFRLARQEIEFILDNADAVLLFADEEFAQAADGLKPTVLLDAEAQRDSRRLSGAAEKPAAAHCLPGDLFRLMYTSGTTDRPKGVMHTYENFYWKSWDHIADLPITADDRLLVVGPLYHVGAFDCGGVAVFLVGGMMVIHRNFDPEQALAAIERERITCSWMAPVMMGSILACEQRDRYDVSSFRWCIGGGEKTPENRVRLFSGLFRNGRYIDAYGLTETCGGDTFMEAGRELEKIGSTGRVVGHAELRICDELGMEVPPGVEGEICLRGPKVTRGYWKEEEKTRSSFFGEWFRTGDIGRVDQDGFLYLTDRLKDMIITGGENVASSEVERVIFMLPQVAEVAVVGCPDQRWGERPVAVLALAAGQSLDLETLSRHCRQHLAGFKVPKQLVIVPALPRNPSGKVLKRLLRQELSQRDGESAQSN